MTEAFRGWVILELMGHRRLAGYLTADPPEMPGLLRIDVPGEDETPVATQYYNHSSVYCITPTTEDMAKRTAAMNRPAPVVAWELSRAAAIPANLDREPDPDDRF